MLSISRSASIGRTCWGWVHHLFPFSVSSNSVWTEVMAQGSKHLLYLHCTGECFLSEIHWRDKNRGMKVKSSLCMLLMSGLFAFSALSAEQQQADKVAVVLKQLTNEIPKGGPHEIRILTATVAPGAATPGHTHASPPQVSDPAKPFLDEVKR
jgi:hypothetical protein